MKYQYNLESSQQESKVKTFLVRGFLFLSLFGILYQGYKFFESTQSKLKRGNDQYCGNSTCYELLNVNIDASDQQIKKNYRLLARKYHPDKSKQEKAVEIFQVLNKAYQTLSDEKSRFIYDLYLKNPQQSQYYRQFEYYNHKYIENPQIPVPAVIIGIILCISALQYVMRKQMYQKAIERISESHDFKIKVNQRCGNNKKQKEKVREQMISQIQIEGGLAKPTYQDIFVYKIVMGPWRLVIWIKQSVMWIIKYWILRQSYSFEAKEYLTKKALSISDRQWKNMDQKQKISLTQKQLWIQMNKKSFISQKRKEWLQELRVNNPNKYNMVIKYLKQNKIQ